MLEGSLGVGEERRGVHTFAVRKCDARAAGDTHLAIHHEGFLQAVQYSRGHLVEDVLRGATQGETEAVG
jgi:hypothetical protein